MVSSSSGFGAGTETFPKVGTGTAISDGSTILPVCLCNSLISARLEKKISLLKHTFGHFNIFTLTTVLNYGPY